MIGHYLLTLTAEQEDRVLTCKMLPGAYVETPSPGHGPCLVGTAHGGFPVHEHLNHWPFYADLGVLPTRHVEKQYDSLCERFGTERINAAIRDRILRNRARRALAGVPEVADARS